MSRLICCAVTGLFILSLSYIRALASDVTLQIIVDPADDANQLIERVRFQDKTLASSFNANGTIVDIAVPDDASQQLQVPLTLLWKDGTPGGIKSTTFPIVVVSSFAGQTVDIDFDAAEVMADPDIKTIRQDCLQTAPQAIADMFKMLYTCSAYAHELEDSNEAWQPADRNALQGWLIANYALFSINGGVLSPYGVDVDLLTRLRYAISQAKTKGDTFFTPIRLDDARALVNAVDQQSIRLVSTVGTLMQNGQLEEAQRINDAALAHYDTLGTNAPVFGITREVLLGNQALIATKLRQNVSPSP